MKVTEQNNKIIISGITINQAKRMEKVLARLMPYQDTPNQDFFTLYEKIAKYFEKKQLGAKKDE